MPNGFAIASSGNNIRYSTTEQWTGGYDDDGRKIYRKVIKGTTAAGNETSKIFAVGAQVENYIIYWAIAKSVDGSGGISQFIYPSVTGTSGSGRVISAFPHTNTSNPDSIQLDTINTREKNQPVKIYVFYTKVRE